MNREKKVFLSEEHFSRNIGKIIIVAFRAAFLERENNMLKKELEDANFRSLLVQCCGTGMFIRISDPEYEFFPSWIRIFPSRIRTSEFKYFKFEPKKLFISSRKYDPGYSSRIRILIYYPSRIPDPGV